MDNFRSQFPILKQKINGKPLVYFDNAATTQKPKNVIGAIKNFYETANSNVHRSLNPLGEKATRMYEDARKKIAEFIGAKYSEEIIFTKNATESLNLIAKTLGKKILKKGDKVVLAITEHHSNIVPWLELKKEIGIKLSYIPLDENGDFDIETAKKYLSEKNVKILSFAHASNALGTILPIEEIIKAAKINKVITIVDAAQSVAHIPIDVQKLGCDFLVFSGHKMYGPTGIGVVWGRKKILESMPPFLGGGDMILEVTQENFTAKGLPWKFEAGTPHIAGAIGLAEAVRFIQSIGFEKIQKIEKELAEYLYKKLSSLEFLEIYGPKISENHLPLYSFNIKWVHAHDVADLLGEEGICTRAGHHCTMPLHRSLGIPASCRASLAFYNTKEEIDIFIEVLGRIYKKFK